MLSRLADVAEWVSAERSPVHFDCPGRSEMDPAGLDLDRSCLAGGRRIGLAAVRTGAGIDGIEKDLVDFDPVHCSRLKDPGRHIGTGLAVPRTERDLAGPDSGLRIGNRLAGLGHVLVHRIETLSC